jgi:hypothetical protein
MRIDDDGVVVCERSGQARLGAQVRSANSLGPQIEEFLTSLRSNPAEVRSTLREHLPTMAVIQAAYLSARTGQPESPGSILEMHHIQGTGKTT